MTSAGEERRKTNQDVCSERTEGAWGVIASDVFDAKACIGQCQKQFFQRLLPRHDWTSFNWTLFDDNAETIPLEACEALLTVQGENNDPLLWELYCCDTLLCGVQTGDSLRLDPNVNSAMLHCQGRGIPPLHDPGPPHEGYTCPANSVTQGEDGLPCQRSNRKFADILPGSSIDGASITAITTEPRPQPSMTTTSTSSPASGTVVLTQPEHKSVLREGPSRLSAGSRAAIAVCSVLALIAVLAAILYLLRRRRRRRHHGYPPGLQYVGGPIKLGGSPTPLISPTTSANGQPRSSLPPLRLRDRRLLPNILGSARTTSEHSMSIPGSPPAPPPTYSGFPQSPLRSPATNKLVPRFEQVPRIHGRSSGATAAKTASLSSSGSAHTANVSAHSSAPPSSPSRPPRPHEAPLEIPDLVRPSTSRGQTPRPGPPPSRALPPAPPVSPISGSWPSMPPGHVHGDVGVAIGLVSHNPAQGVTLQPESQDLCELTERFGRESRDSWGSWGGTGGGGPGIVLSSPQKKGAGARGSPVLEEADLERMGGSY